MTETTVERHVWLIADLIAATGFSETAIRRMVARGQLPRPGRAGKHRVWQAAEVRRALDEITGAATRGQHQ